MNAGSAIGLGAVSAAYAALLNTKRGRAFAQEYTWASVVIGVGLVLSVLRRELDDESWNRVAVGFLVAGTPMVARSLLNRARRG